MKQGATHMELSNAFVRVIEGRTRQGDVITDHVFRMLGTLGKDQFGTYITVDGSGHSMTRNGKARVYVKPTSFEMIDAKTGERAVAADPAEDVEQRSDDEIGAELKETFDILAEMTSAVATGVIKGLVISGPAGVGKSHTVETVLEEMLGVPARIQSIKPSYEIISGHISPIMLYTKLYEYADKNAVLVLDDCDVLEDLDALNILKAALDTKKTRRIHWGTASHVLEKEGVPTSFEFHGGVIFLTNTKLNNVKSAKLAPHAEAIISRVHYLDLQIDTMRERMIHIRNIVLNSDMLDSYEFGKKDRESLMSWLLDNVERIAQVDLRTVIKAADLCKAMPHNWQSRAAKTLFKHSGRR
jgi:hypothetical protein